MKGGDHAFQLLTAASCLLLVGYFIRPTFLLLPNKIETGPATVHVRVTRVTDLNYPPTFFGRVGEFRGELAWQEMDPIGPSASSRMTVGSRITLFCKQFSSGRGGVVWCRSPKTISVKPPPVWRQKLNRLSERAEELWQAALPGPAGGFVEALLTGNEKRLGPAVRDDFRRTGLQHVLALSGYNVTVLLVWLGWMLGAGGLKNKWRLIFLSFFLFFYAALTGFSPSLVRAALFGAVALWTRGLGVLVRPGRLVWLTGLLTLWFEPLQIWSVSFLLSYTAFAGILCLAPPLSAKGGSASGGKPREGWGELLAPPLAATLATFPVLVLTFGTWSILSLPANLLLAPLWPLTLFFAWSGTFILWIFSSGWWFAPWRFIFDGTLGLVSLFSRLPVPLQTIPSFGWIGAVVWYAELIFFMARFPPCQRRKMW